MSFYHGLEAYKIDVQKIFSSKEESADDFKTADLNAEIESDLEESQGEKNNIAKLAQYLRTVTTSTYKREDFDTYLDDAKLELQFLNYRKQEQKGFLQEEKERLQLQVDHIPLFLACVAVLAVLILGIFHETWSMQIHFIWESLTFLKDSFEIDPALAYPFVIAFGILIIVPGIGVLVSQVPWLYQFVLTNNCVEEAKRIRQKNHDVLKNKIKTLQAISGAYATNKNPQAGSDGLLRVYLLFICGYVLHKMLDRCHTRFAEDFEEIIIANVRARLRAWRFASIISLVTPFALIGYVYVFDYNKFRGEFGTAHLILLHFKLIILPLLTGWCVDSFLHHYAMRKGGRVKQHLEFVKGLYEEKIPSEILKKFKETEDHRELFDYPNLYEYNDIEEYSAWLHKTLMDLQRHENAVRRG